MAPKSWVAASVIAGVIAIFSPGLCSAQTERVRTPKSCEDCKITLSYVASLGLGAGASAPSAESRVVRLSSGSYFVAPTFTKGQISIFDQSGRLIKAVGKPGQGPGEFGVISWLDAMGETVYAADLGNGRVSLLDATGNLEREHSLRTYIRRFVVLPDHSLAMLRITPVMPGASPTEASPFARMSASGHITDFPQAKASMSRFTSVIARGDSGRVFIINADDYIIRRYGPGGNQDFAVRRDNWRSARQAFGGRRPGGSVVDARQVGSELWVIWHQVHPELAPKQQPFRNGEPIPHGPAALAGYIDTVIEVINLQSGTVTTAGITPNVLSGFADDAHVYGIRELPSGELTAEVWQFRIRR